MSESVIIRCPSCGYERRIDKTWLRQPGWRSSAKQALINVLRDNYDRLSCARCGRKEPELIGQGENRKPKNQSSGTNQRHKTSMNTKAISESKSPSKPSLSPRTLEARKTLEAIMNKSAAWLYSNEMSRLDGFLVKIKSGKELSKVQFNALERIQRNIRKRKQPRVFLGGSPGGGRRR